MSVSKKILHVQLYSNGDCLYGTTIAQQIKTDYPNCHLTWAIASFCKPIIFNNPFIDEIISIEGIAKNDVIAYRKLKQQFLQQKANGVYDEVFFIQNMDDNQAYYDGCIRSNVLNAYPKPITVSIQPVLQLTNEELQAAKNFAETNNLSQYQNIVLFEFAPQSGQSKLTKENAISIAEKLVADSNTAVIMSSAQKINHSNKAIIDGSVLSVRENAAITHYCSFLLGTSSGITWLSTSTGAKQLPMIQLLNAYTKWVNPISRDFERFGMPTNKVIELINFDEAKIVVAMQLAFIDFAKAKQQFNEKIPLHFYTTRSIVYNLICYLQFNAIAKHIKMNRKIYGNNFSFYKQVALGFIDFPFKLAKNVWRKKIMKK